MIPLSFIGNTTSPIARVIEHVPGGAGPVCHVDAIDDDGMYWGARLDKKGAPHTGFYPRHPTYCIDDTTHIIVALPCTNLQQNLFWDATYRDRGAPYDWLGIVNFGVQRDWHLKAAGFCSEAQALHLEQAGIFNPLPASTWTITPMALLMMCCAYPGMKVLRCQGFNWPAFPALDIPASEAIKIEL